MRRRHRGPGFSSVVLAALAIAACNDEGGPIPYGPPDVPPPLAAPLRGRFVEVGAVDLGGGDPSYLQIARPLWRGPDRISVFENGNLRARELRFEGGQLVAAVADPLYALGDVDGDGVDDCVRGNRVEWGCGTEATTLPDYLNPLTLVADVDRDGRADIVTAPRLDRNDAPPLRWLRQVAPRTFAPAPPPTAPCVRVNLYRLRRDGAVVAVGWNCDDLPPDHRQPAKIWHRFDGAAWSVLPDPAGYEPGSPMDYLELDQEGRCYLVAEHPAHVEVCDGARVEQHPGFDWQRAAESREPMIPWTAERIVVDGRELILIAHGIDAYGNDEHRRIGVGREHVTVWERSGPGQWALIEGTGLEREGEWRWTAVGELDGAPGVFVGGYGEPARLYRYQAP